MKTAALPFALCLGLSCLATAQTVTLSGMLGGKALLIVDGSPPKSVAAGETYKAVKVISTQGDSAVLEVAQQRLTLRVGETPTNVGGAVPTSGGSKVVLSAGSGGHFTALGQINGRTVQMLVDTGATGVGIGMALADQIGINYKSGQMMRVGTATGVVLAWRIKLATVQIGDVFVREVDASVVPGDLPVVLLGNSFLSHFQMTRTNDQMVLEKRY